MAGTTSCIETVVVPLPSTITVRVASSKSMAEALVTKMPNREKNKTIQTIEYFLNIIFIKLICMIETKKL